MMVYRILEKKVKEGGGICVMTGMDADYPVILETTSSDTDDIVELWFTRDEAIEVVTAILEAMKKGNGNENADSN